MKQLCLLLFTALLFSTNLHCSQIDDFDSFIEQNRSKWNVPGLSVVIVNDGKVILSKGYGVTEVNSNHQVNESTIFQLASITKSFTAAALGVLVDQKKLSWDDLIINYLPEFALFDPYPTRYCSTRDLLAHRTGLPAFGGDLLGKLGYKPDEILRRIRFIKPASSFRDKAHYSNVGYFVAGELLGKISNSSWEEAIKNSLIEPLQMNRTGFSDNLDTTNVAKGHALNGDIIEIVDWDRSGGFGAAGAMTSTAEDMGNWMLMLLNHGVYGEKKLLNSDTVKDMFISSMVGEVSFSEVEPINEFSGFDFGLGWGNYHYMGEMIVEKGGGLDGIRTLTTLVPEKKLGITILANLNLTLFPEALRAKFLQIFVGNDGHDYQPEIQKKNIEIQKLLNPPEENTKALPSTRPLGDFVGVFESPLYGKFEVKQEGNKLGVEAGPIRLKGTLTHLGLDTFILKWPVVNSGSDPVTFTFGPDGKAIEFTSEAFGRFSSISKTQKS